jgi:hypothetical protein
MASRETKIDDMGPAIDAATAFEGMLSFLLVGQGGEEALAEVQSLFQAFQEYAPLAKKGLVEDIVREIKSAAASGTGERLSKVKSLWDAQKKRDNISTNFYSKTESAVEVDMSGPLDFLPCTLPCSTSAGCGGGGNGGGGVGGLGCVIS